MPDARVRQIMIGASLVRLTYALGLAAAPRAMSRIGLGPDVDDPFTAMTVRAFGAVHVNVALATLAAVATGRNTDVMARLNLGCDLGDLAVTIAAAARDGLPRDMTAIGVVAQSGTAATWATVLAHQ